MDAVTLATTSGDMLRDVAPGSWTWITRLLDAFTRGFVNMTYGTDSFTYAEYGLENVDRIRVYIEAVLPSAIVIIGIIIAIKVAIRIFKKFSR